MFRDCLVGRADLKLVIAPFLHEWRWIGSVDSFTRCWFEEEHVIDSNLMDTVDSLRRKEVYRGLATNQERYRLEYMKNVMGFSGSFDATFGFA